MTSVHSACHFDLRIIWVSLFAFCRVTLRSRLTTTVTTAAGLYRIQVANVWGGGMQQQLMPDHSFNVRRRHVDTTYGGAVSSALFDFMEHVFLFLLFSFLYIKLIFYVFFGSWTKSSCHDCCWCLMYNIFLIFFAFSFLLLFFLIATYTDYQLTTDDYRLSNFFIFCYYFVNDIYLFRALKAKMRLSFTFSFRLYDFFSRLQHRGLRLDKYCIWKVCWCRERKWQGGPVGGGSRKTTKSVRCGRNVEEKWQQESSM